MNKNVLPYIVSESQTAYVNKSFISEGGRLIDNLLEIFMCLISKAPELLWSTKRLPIQLILTFYNYDT